MASPVPYAVGDGGADVPLGPHLSFSFLTCSRPSPVLSFTLKCASTSSTVLVCAFSMAGCCCWWWWWVRLASAQCSPLPPHTHSRIGPGRVLPHSALSIRAPPPRARRSLRAAHSSTTRRCSCTAGGRQAATFHSVPQCSPLPLLSHTPSRLSVEVVGRGLPRLVVAVVRGPCGDVA